jgi:predicted nuclease with TOPRIM domain
MKSHLDEDVKGHLDMMKKKFSAMKVAYEKECNKNEELGNELDEAWEELGEANYEKAEAEGALEAVEGKLEAVREELEKVKQELEDKKVQLQRQSATEDMTLVKKLCILRQESEFCQASDQILVSNLPPQTTEQMVKSIFGQHGQVYAVKLFPDFNIAVVEYRFAESVSAMFHKYHSSGIRLRGYQLKCISLEN